MFPKHSTAYQKEKKKVLIHESETMPVDEDMGAQNYKQELHLPQKQLQSVTETDLMHLVDFHDM